MSDDHSEVVPLLPIPNRTVKRFCADDSAGSRVKVGHRQTLTASISPTQRNLSGAFVFLEPSRVFKKSAHHEDAAPRVALSCGASLH